MRTIAHDEFVNGVVNDFLDQDIDAVIILRSVAHAPDVHAGAFADVLQRGERLNLAFVIDVEGFSHGGISTEHETKSGTKTQS